MPSRRRIGIEKTMSHFCNGAIAVSPGNYHKTLCFWHARLGAIAGSGQMGKPFIHFVHCALLASGSAANIDIVSIIRKRSQTEN
jgi:hypothetical protein